MREEIFNTDFAMAEEEPDQKDDDFQFE